MAVGRPISLTPNVARKVITKTATAGQTDFTVTGGYRINRLGVYRNGVRLVNGDDYSATDGSSVGLSTGAFVGDSIEFEVYDSFNIDDAINANAANQTIDGNLNITGTLSGISSAGAVPGINTGGHSVLSTVAASGITTISATTGSTSSTTGALVVSGGVGIAKSLFVGEGISVAGTITYNDVTNVDSIGIVTAAKGLRATAGGLIVTAGVSTFTAAIDANSTSDLGGSVTVSAGELTVSAGNVKVTAGIVTVGAGVTISSDFIHLGDNKKIQLGIASDLTIQHNATNSVINNTTGQLRLAGDDLRLMNKDEDETYATFANDGAATLYYDNSTKLATNGGGIDVTGHVETDTLKVSGITTLAGDRLDLDNGTLVERVNRNTSAAANAATALDLDDGMVHWFTTNLGAANVKMNVVSGVGINTALATGDMISVTIMTAVNSTSNFIEQLRVDGVEASAGVTTYWTGGSAPTDGGGSGVDTYAFSLVKTGSGTYDMIANQVKGS